MKVVRVAVGIAALGASLERKDCDGNCAGSPGTATPYCTVVELQ